MSVRRAAVRGVRVVYFSELDLLKYQNYRKICSRRSKLSFKRYTLGIIFLR